MEGSILLYFFIISLLMWSSPIGALVAFVLSIMLYSQAFASGQGGVLVDANNTYSIDQILRVGIALAILISGVLSVCFIIWWGIMLILSGGKDDRIKPAINTIRYAVIGLVLIILSIFVVPRITALLGFDISKFVSPPEIFATIRELSGKILNNGNGGSTIQEWTIGTWASNNNLPSNFSDLP
jgi:hypothetical protein